jgi:serine/threonine protein kinase/tetratricopeptide (TPR) repeat protein
MADEHTPPENDFDPTETFEDEETEAAPTAAVSHVRIARQGGRIGPYKLLEKIGEGGMGEVWRAEQTEPVRRPVAIKVIKRGMDSKDFVARFEAERQALAMMDHATIARVYDAGETDDSRPYLVMEYIHGEPITKYCDSKRLSTAERIDLFIQVCAGIQHAHQKAIIHRDIKPSNVLVTIQDGTPVPKIIDFGVAKALAQPLTDKTMFTELGQVIGTPEYMSPEQAEMTGLNIDTRTDVYSLGILLYQLLVGAMPFDPKDLRAAGYSGMMKVIRESEPPRPSTRFSSLGEASKTSAERRRTEPAKLRSVLAGDLDWVVMKAIEKDRSRRYDTANGFAMDLRRFLENEPVSAGPPSGAYKARKFVQRHRVAVAASGAFVVLLLAFIAALAMLYVRASRAEAAAVAARDESEAVTAFLVDVFEVSDPGEARGNTVTAREILDQGAARARTSFADRPGVQARLLTTIGNVYSSLGLYDASEEQLVAALEIKRQTLGESHIEVAEAMDDLAFHRRLMGKYDEAEAIYRQTVEVYRETYGDDHAEVAHTLLALATTLHAKGEYDQAEPLYIQANQMAARHYDEDDIEIAGFINNYANFLADISRAEEAEALYRRSLAIKRQHYGEVHPEVAFALDNLAMILHDQLDYEGARPLYFQAQEMLYEIYGHSHPEVAQTLGNVSSFLMETGDWDRAEEMVHEELRLNLELLGPDHWRIGDSHQALAEIEMEKGNLESAEQHALKSLDIYRAALPEGHLKIAGGESSLGHVYLMQGRHREAESILLRSYEAMEAVQDRALYRIAVLESLIELYEETGRTDLATDYTQRLEILEAEATGG